MIKNQRQAQILEILKEEGFAGVRELGERLYASQPTIRRDLDALEHAGYVRRSHGGVALADGKTNTPVPFRKGKMTKEKTRICRLAATLIHPGDLVLADASTTVFFLSECLREEDDVTVVTNGITLCRALSDRHVRTFCTGGRPVRESEAFVGPIAERAVRGFFADLMFFSSSALDADGAISDYSEEENALRMVMRERSERVVFLCDSGKLPSRSAFSDFTLADVDYLVSDAPIPDELAARCGLVLDVREEGAVLYKRA